MIVSYRMIHFWKLRILDWRYSARLLDDLEFETYQDSRHLYVKFEGPLMTSFEYP